MALEAAELLSASFLTELEALRRRVRLEVRSGGAGEQTSRRRGSSAEFEEHRPYLAGDDLRRVDWLATARTGQPVLKQFRAEEDAVLRLLLDGSASLGFGAPPKLETAQRLAAALGYLALAGSQRAQLLLASGAGLEHAFAPHRGRAGLPALLRELGQARAEGGVSLARAIQQTVQRAARPGALVVLSDFFEPMPALEALAGARARGHELTLVQVLAREELEPDLDGDLRLVDSETGAAVELTADPEALGAYAARLAALLEQLQRFARRYGAAYLRVTSGEPLEGPVRRFLAREVD